MPLDALWDRYTAARLRFELDPSPKHEGETIAAYAEWVRLFAPVEAKDLISLLCRHLAWLMEEGFVRRLAA